MQTIRYFRQEPISGCAVQNSVVEGQRDIDHRADGNCVACTANRDFVVDYVKGHLPGIRSTVPQATYLAWLDCSDLVKSGSVTGTPHEFFLKQARVALNEGRDFGPGGEGFVRLNFGCPRCVLEEGLQRMLKALR